MTHYVCYTTPVPLSTKSRVVSNKYARRDAKKTNDVVPARKAQLLLQYTPPCLSRLASAALHRQVFTRPRTASVMTDMKDIDAGSTHLVSSWRCRHSLYTRNGDKFISFPMRSDKFLWQLFKLSLTGPKMMCVHRWAYSFTRQQRCRVTHTWQTNLKY